jgi:hypothetical protein
MATAKQPFAFANVEADFDPRFARSQKLSITLFELWDIWASKASRPLAIHGWQTVDR